MPLPGWCQACLAVLQWGRRAETQEWATWSDDPLGCTGKNNSPDWSAFGRSGTDFLGVKDPTDTNMLPYSLTKEGRHQLRAANLGAGFWLCYTINSKLLFYCVTNFQDRLRPDTMTQWPRPEDQFWLAPGGSLKFGVLKPSHMPEMKKWSITWPGRQIDWT